MAYQNSRVNACGSHPCRRITMELFNLYLFARVLVWKWSQLRNYFSNSLTTMSQFSMLVTTSRTFTCFNFKKLKFLIRILTLGFGDFVQNISLKQFSFFSEFRLTQRKKNMNEPKNGKKQTNNNPITNKRKAGPFSQNMWMNHTPIYIYIYIYIWMRYMNA